MTTLTEGLEDLRARVAGLPDSAVIEPREYAAWLCISVRELDRRLKARAIPGPLKGFGSQTRRFLVGDIRRWLVQAV